MNQVIELIVSPQGQVHMETKGFSGSTCRDASRVIELALGKIASEHLTSEFYRHSQVESLSHRQT